MRFLRGLACLLIIFCTSFTAQAATKVALVIGNGAYANANPLPNPANDATDMVAALEKLGFIVYGGNDLDFATMGAKIGEFADAAEQAEVTLFFYAGHGVQVNGRNYLIPVDAKLEREATLQFEAIDSEMVLGVMAGPTKTAIALLDACRDNPLPRSFKPARTSAIARGLAAPNIAGGGMLIGFSTSPSQTAADGTPGSRNSPFTAALLKNIDTPGLEIQSLMTRVKADVYKATKQEQQPWHNSSLREEFYLVPQTKSDFEQTPTGQDVQAEWSALKESKSLAALDAFIASHPDQLVFIALAESRKAQVMAQDKTVLLDALKTQQAETPQPEAPIVLKGLKLKGVAWPRPGSKDQTEQLALNLEAENRQAIPKQSSTLDFTPQKFFQLAKDVNSGKTTLSSLIATGVVISAPTKNPGKKSNSFNLNKIAEAPALQALLASNPQLSFSPEASMSCLLHWVDRCPFLSQTFFEGLSSAMAAAGLDIMNGADGFYAINRIAGSTDYLVSNNPRAGVDGIGIVAAIMSENLEIKQVYWFDVSPAKLGTAAGSPDADVKLTWSALEGDDLYVSFDATHRCTESPVKFGFIVKFGMKDQIVKWVSPFNVNDSNFIIKEDYILSSNGGSCVDDFIYKLNKDNGEIIGRTKLPIAAEYLDSTSGALVVQLYEGAAAYNLD
jgi:Caspase domain